MLKVVNDKNLVLEYDDELNCIFQTWKGYFTSEFFRQGVEKTNKLFSDQKPVTKFLVDIQESSVIKKDDTDWAARTAIPLAIEKGLQYYGFVLPKNVFTQVSLKNFQKELNQPTITVRLFDDMGVAKAWVESL